MKAQGTNKFERRLAFRSWRRHIGAAERVQFEESRRKVTLQEEIPSSLPVSPPRQMYSVSKFTIGFIIKS